jgi:Protein of unknown function (DUF3040)
MLSDAEQRQLTAIESRLREDDPQLAQRLSTAWDSRLDGRWERLATLLNALWLAAAFIGLVAANVVVMVIALMVLGVRTGLWITQRRRPGS